MSQTKEVKNNQNFFEYKKQIENELNKQLENEGKVGIFILGTLLGRVLFSIFGDKIKYLTNLNYHQYTLFFYPFIITIGYFLVKLLFPKFKSSNFFKKKLNQEILYETGVQRKPLIINIIGYSLLIAPLILTIVLNYYDFFRNNNFLVRLVFFLRNSVLILISVP